MRRLGTLLTALLLAAAAAAGAGDDIKWKRSKDLTYVAPDADAGPFAGEFEELSREYTLTWRKRPGDYVFLVEARYYGWDLFCANLHNLAREGKFEPSELQKRADESRDYFRDNLVFYVTVGAERVSEARLSNRMFWTIYADAGREKLEPEAVEPVENPVVAELTLSSWSTFSPTIEVGIYPYKSYVVRFANPYRNTRPEAVRLVLTSKDCRRGFEWRFKQD
jgi:hypothetical protein